MVVADKNFNEIFGHYCPSVDDATRDFMATLVTNVAEELIDRLDDTVDYETTLDVCSGIPYDGFYPFTDGGCEVVISACLGDADKGTVPPLIREDFEATLKECQECFCKEHGIPKFDDIWDDGSLFSSLREEYYDYENQWLSNESDYFYKVRATQKEGVVTFLVMLNRDYEYGRDSLASAGLPHVDPNSNVTEENFRVEDIPDLDPEEATKDLMPIILMNLEV